MRVPAAVWVPAVVRVPAVVMVPAVVRVPAVWVPAAVGRQRSHNSCMCLWLCIAQGQLPDATPDLLQSTGGVVMSGTPSLGPSTLQTVEVSPTAAE